MPQVITVFLNKSFENCQLTKKKVALIHSVAWVYLFDFFCSGIQFYLLLSSYLCFMHWLYLDVYVLGDDALIS